MVNTSVIAAGISAQRINMWAAVDRLTISAQRTVTRDDGTLTFTSVPSLWAQSTDALSGGLEGSARNSSSSERSPLDLQLMDVRTLMRRYTTTSLRVRNVVPNMLGTARQMRQLAALVVTTEPTRMWWWEYRFTSWARLLSALLATNEHAPSALRLRNSPCPACHVRQVVIESDDGMMVVPPLVIDFRDGYVRAAQCTGCNAMWWRGTDLEALATALGVGLGQWAC